MFILHFGLKEFQKISKWLIVTSVITFVLSLIAGLYLGFNAPPDYQQGETVRIMYVHVPAAWLSLGAYMGVFFASISFLVWRNPLSDMIAEVSARIGVWFTLITLVTGSLWGKPMWGTWWVWDARLTSVLFLLFLYMGLIVLRNAYENKERGGKITAVLAIIGFINIPIIKFSVDWWNSLHQPASVLRPDGPAIHSSMLWPLLLMFLGFFSYYVLILTLKLKTGILDKKINRAKMIK